MKNELRYTLDLQLFAGEFVVRHTAVTEGQLEHPALPAELVFPDGIEIVVFLSILFLFL